LADAARPRFERFVADLYTPQHEQLGWDARPTDSADERIRRATVVGALGQLACLPGVALEARTRLEQYFGHPSSLDPNLASVVVSIAARNGDAPLYERYLERKRAAAGDPEEEQRFLFGLTAFDDETLVRRTLDLTLTSDVRPQDRAHLLARLLGGSRSRAAAWTFVRDRWTDITRGMDPMLQQNIVRGLSQLTPEPIAKEVETFLPNHTTDETRETIAQAMEQLRIDVAACRRLAPDVSFVLSR
jgi:puromycin-sensitive aminopeptidase